MHWTTMFCLAVSRFQLGSMAGEQWQAGRQEPSGLQVHTLRTAWRWNAFVGPGAIKFLFKKVWVDARDCSVFFFLFNLQILFNILMKSKSIIPQGQMTINYYYGLRLKWVGAVKHPSLGSGRNWTFWNSAVTQTLSLWKKALPLEPSPYYRGGANSMK